MDDTFNLLIPDNLLHKVLIARVTDNQRYALGDGPVKSRRQVVKYNYVFTGIGQFVDHMTADVPGTASYKD